MHVAHTKIVERVRAPVLALQIQQVNHIEAVSIRSNRVLQELGVAQDVRPQQVQLVPLYRIKAINTVDILCGLACRLLQVYRAGLTTLLK